MNAAGIRELKKELLLKSNKDLIEICLHLAKFKKESKELLTYLLFEASNEEAYRDSIKEEIELRFEHIPKAPFYTFKKNIRKILRDTKKYIRFSKNPETDVELRLYFCEQMLSSSSQVRRSSVLSGIIERELISIEKKMVKLHEDLQYDFGIKIKEIESRL